MKTKVTSAQLSHSVFTIEVDRNPVLAVQFKKHSEAEAILSDESLRRQMRLVQSGGRPLYDNYSIFRIRLARESERALYYKNAASLLTADGQLAVLLVALDDDSAQG